MVTDRLVLVVDDTPITRQGTALVVQMLGFKTDEAASGPEALEKVRATVYAVILMDYNMPEMDGIECTARIRELEKKVGRRTPIIGMTASTESDIRETCLRAGMDDYLDKSCNNAALRDMLIKWVPVCTSVK